MKAALLAAAVASLALECQVESNFSRKKHQPPPPSSAEEVEREPDGAAWAPLRTVTAPTTSASAVPSTSAAPAGVAGDAAAPNPSSGPAPTPSAP